MAPDRWAFGRCQTGRASLVPTRTDICLFDGFTRDRVYELIYPARNPMVMGLGYVVTRDVASFLRYELRDEAGNPNPLAAGAADTGIRRAYGAGISSTGMYMRDFLYLGFNEDEAHRKVFDAVQIAIPGTHRLLANVEFADPNTYSRQDMWHDSLSYSYPPLTFAVTTDPISGIRDGILKRPATDPLVFQVDSANEFLQMNASLNVHDGQGRPVPTPDNVRLYFASSFHHVGVSGLLNPPGQPGMCELATQGNGWAPTLRALLVALDEWADRGIAPPPSNYPRVEDGMLVGLADLRAAFPSLAGVRLPDGAERAGAARLRSRLHVRRRTRVQAAAVTRGALPGAGPQNRSRRTGSRRHPIGGSVGADCDDHRLERPRDRTQAGRSVRVERRDDPVCEDQGRAGGQRRIRGRRWKNATGARTDSSAPSTTPRAGSSRSASCCRRTPTATCKPHARPTRSLRGRRASRADKKCSD